MDHIQQEFVVVSWTRRMTNHFIGFPTNDGSSVTSPNFISSVYRRMATELSIHFETYATFCSITVHDTMPLLWSMFPCVSRRLHLADNSGNIIIYAMFIVLRDHAILPRSSVIIQPWETSPKSLVLLKMRHSYVRVCREFDEFPPSVSRAR